MSNWQDFLSRNQQGVATSTPADGSAEPLYANLEGDEAITAPDPAQYRAFLLQRGSGRPPLFIDLRRFDPRSGALIGTLMSYPQLTAVDYVDGHSAVLNFGLRQFRIEGQGLEELILRLHAGSVAAIQEYTAKLWPKPPLSGPVVRRIVEMREQEDT
ncbi:MAG: hypothetical protein KDJ29_21090 [Hyphomicrobiales bacterium]|nr:hypothetical protein [Hyphomicrobiales bacterium]